MEIYSPVNPLPDEIQKMDNDETVCKFCGVSYLIHNEIKKLQEELKRCEDKVRMYDQLKSQYDQMSGVCEGLAGELKESQEKVLAVSGKLTVRVSDNERLKEENTALTEEIRRCEEEIRGLEKEVKKARQMYPTLLSMQKQVEVLKETKAAYVTEMGDYQKGMQGLFGELNQAYSEIEKRISKSAEVEKSNALEMTELHECVSKLEAEKTSLSSLVEQLQHSSSSLGHTQDQNVKLSRLLRDTQNEVEKLTQEMRDESEKSAVLSNRIGSKNEEIEELKQHLNSLTKKFTLQIDELNKKHKSSLSMQDTLKSKIASHVSEYEGVIKEKELNKNNKMELEIANQTLTSTLNALNSEYKQLKHNTEHSSTSHQHQIKQLQQSYQDQLTVAITKQDSSSYEVTRLKKLLEKLSREVVVRIEDAVQQNNTDNEKANKKVIAGYESSRRELEKQIQSLSDTYSLDLKSKHDSIAELERSYQAQFTDVKTDNQNLKEVIKKLKSHLSDYEVKLAELNSKPKSQPMDDEKAKALTEQNSKLESEVLSLERMVQKECEERRDLTDALENARSQLAAIRNVGSESAVRNAGSSSLSSNSLENTKPNTGNNGVAKNRRRIENTIGRMSHKPGTRRKGSVAGNDKRMF